MKDLQMAKQIANIVADKGGKTYFVGGYVRDKILGIDNKDIDIEIHGISVDTLVDILNDLGKVDLVGASFGVFKLQGYDLDIAMPRSEKANGNGGHKDFSVSVDPFIGIVNACRRRDLTINAIMQDVLTGDIVDPFGGVNDIKTKVIRVVDKDTFVDDPLRVLRVAQFAARFGFTVDNDTVDLCSTMDLSKLPAERILGELNKALIKGTKPSMFFNSLRAMNQLDTWFSPVDDLVRVPQSIVHHPEGDVYNHTMLVLDQAAKVRHMADNKFAFMLAALCHDFGKIDTTVVDVETGKITSYGHDKCLDDVIGFLKTLKVSNKDTDIVLNLVSMHMKPNQMYSTAKFKSMMKLWDDSLCPQDLILLAQADHLGRGGQIRDYSSIYSSLVDSLKDYNTLINLPKVNGRDLINLGMKPGPVFRQALDYAYKLHLAGVPKDNALKQVAGMFL